MLKKLVKTITAGVEEMFEELEDGEYIQYITTQLGFESVEAMLKDYALLRQQRDASYAKSGPVCCPKCHEPVFTGLKTDKDHCPSC